MSLKLSARSFGFFIGITHLFSQSTPPVIMPPLLKLQDQTLFTENEWIFLPLEGDPFVIANEGSGSHDVRLPTEGIRFGYRSFRNGFFWDIRRVVTKEGSKEINQSFLFKQAANSKSAAWEKVGQIDTTCGMTNYLIPIDKDGFFIGISPFFGYAKDGQASLVAIFKLQNEKIELQSLINLPFGTSKNIAKLETITFPLPPLRPGESPNREARKLQNCVFSPSSLRPDLWLPVILPNHLVLASSKTGVLWLLSLKNGDCQRTIDLGHLDIADMEKLGHLDHFLLAATPDQENRLIVSTRSSDVLLFAKSFHTPPGSSEEVTTENKKRFKEIVKEKTDVQWWAIDPETGTQESLNGLGLYPEQLPFERQGQLRFLFTPTGKVHLHSPCSWMDLLSNMGLRMPEKPQAKSEGAPAEQPKPGKKIN